MEAVIQAPNPQAPKMQALNLDAFSDGQIRSKLWLCEELERLVPAFYPNPHIWILGGWYGLLAFLLLSRERIEIASIRAFDLDEAATAVANEVNKNWEIQAWKFRAFTRDANQLDYQSPADCVTPQVVINSACEHFSGRDWWERIPSGTLVVLQSTDMPHREHIELVRDLGELKAKFPMGPVFYEGSREFRYPGHGFTRFMVAGLKS
jgi:hypothetical protein